MTISGISTQYNWQVSSTSNATSPTGKQEAMFQKVDANGDGSIDKSEFAAMHENRPAPPDMELSLEELFAKIDSDGDGTISKDEFAVFDEQLRKQKAVFEESFANENTGMTLAQALAEEEDESTTASPYLRQYQISSLEITRELLNVLG